MKKFPVGFAGPGRRERQDLKSLDQTLVTRYAKYHALKNLLDDWLEKKKAEILAAFSLGAKCPERGPFLLVPGLAEERVSWGAEFFKYLRRKGLSKKAANDLMTAISEKQRPKKPRLYSKRNANYKRKF